MINLRSLIFSGFALIAVASADVETRRAEEVGKRYEQYVTSAGKVYRDVSISKITDAGVSIIHAEGVARLGFEELSAEQRKDFGITKEGAAEIDAKEMEFTAAYKAKVEEQQKAKREKDAKYMAALVEVERLAAEKALRERNQFATTIESTLEIPAFPTIKGLNNGVFYGTGRHTPYRNSYYGGYGYPAYHGYSPRFHRNYYSTGGRCSSSQRSIFHFTIK